MARTKKAIVETPPTVPDFAGMSISAMFDDGSAIFVKAVEPHELSRAGCKIIYEPALVVVLPADVEKGVVVGFLLKDAATSWALRCDLGGPMQIKKPYSLGLAPGALIWRMA